MANKPLTQEEVRRQLTQRMDTIISSAPQYQKDLISQSAISYERRWHQKMPKAKMAVLTNTINQAVNLLTKRGYTQEQIASAVSDLSKVDNPITMLFSLMSIIVPNFAYTEAIGIQPMPTKTAPIFFPQITAVDTRNGVAAGTKLLGASNWNTKNTYSTNKTIVDGASSATGTAVSFTATEASILPGTFVAQLHVEGTGDAVIMDDGKGVIPEVAGFTSGAGTVNYATGTVSFTLAAALATGDTLTFSYRYEFSSTTKPAQVVFQWEDIPVTAQPYRLRSTYELDNFYQAKQVLQGYDIDQVMATCLGGYINKEISGNVFDDMLTKIDAVYTWSATEPTGVAWALHRLSIIQTLVNASNGIRSNIGRSAGNVVVAGTDMMNKIETLGTDLWKPEKYSAEPIGPYVAGTLAEKFKIIKNQDYPSAKAVMCYKRDETDASVLGGSFISLYSTPPLAMDDLSVVQGMGTMMGYEKTLENSIVGITIT